MIINMFNKCGSYAENKDHARDIRVNQLLPTFTVRTPEPIVLDFEGVDSATQSFIHALISEIFQRHGENAFGLIEFKNCNKVIKSVITTVINYSLE
jgi:hypothetical protein